MGVFVLIHSPLVGPLTWALVADELRRRGWDALVSEVRSLEEVGPPYWQRHAEAVARALEPIPLDRPLILVGHSGASVLLPAIRQITRLPVAAYIFVDAAIPEDGASRLDLFESSEAAEQFRQAAAGGFLPRWNDEDLREVIPGTDLRRRFVAELRPLPLAVYEEPLPVFEGWPDAPVGYLRFGQNPVYDRPAERARREGWIYARIEGGHLHMLVDAAAVANALVEFVERMGLKSADKQR